MNTSSTLQTNSESTSVRNTRSLAIMLASCVLFALLIAAGALYAQSQQRTDTATNLTFCTQPRSEWVKLPYRVQVTLAENCATATVTTAQ